MVQFWIFWTLLMAVVTMCATLNTSLYNRLIKLTSFLTNKLKPQLTKTGKLAEIKDLTQNKLPVFEDWIDAALWYSLITFAIQMLLFGVAVAVSFFNSIPFLLLMGVVMLLGSMVMFFPRTLTRWKDVKRAQKFYSDLNTCP